MKIRRHGQTGIATVAIILAVVVVAALAGAGVYVAKHQSKKAAVVTPTTAPTPTSTDASPTPPPTQTTQQYLAIKEWGVQAPYAGNLQLSYTLSADSKVASFSSDLLTGLSSECVGRGGMIVRWASTDKVAAVPDDTTPTATAYFATADPSTYSHVGNYYYMFQHDQAACGDLNVTGSAQSQTNDSVKALVPKLTGSTN